MIKATYIYFLQIFPTQNWFWSELPISIHITSIVTTTKFLVPTPVLVWVEYCFNTVVKLLVSVYIPLIIVKKPASTITSVTVLVPVLR